ncbi:hypothetical protein [Catenulispora sp. EB89]|uniref:hypothetical protein n=1 Tax=Catenulispora sp. EB89 TaxID=3156257 RepID=UPI00351921EA
MGPSRWAWDPDRLDELIRAAAPATLDVCGGADNQQEVADGFTQVFVPEIDEPTMLTRLGARRGFHDWGHIGGTGSTCAASCPYYRSTCGRPVRHPSTPDGL